MDPPICTSTVESCDPIQDTLLEFDCTENFAFESKCDFRWVIAHFQILRVVRTQAIFWQSMSERVGSDSEFEWWISMSTQNRLNMASFKFRVVFWRIRFFPSLISNIKRLVYPSWSIWPKLGLSKAPLDSVGQIGSKNIVLRFIMWLWILTCRTLMMDF